MESLYKLKDSKDDFHSLAVRYYTLKYSVEALKRRKKDLKSNPVLKHKIDNYLLMERLGIEQDVNNESLPFDLRRNASDYLNNPNNVDLKNYMTITKHIVAKQLDMNWLCSRVILGNFFFTTDGRELFSVNNDFTTVNSISNIAEKEFLLGCATREKRIVGNSSSGLQSNVFPIYNNEVDHNNLITTF